MACVYMGTCASSGTGISNRKIAHAVGVSHVTVNVWAKDFLDGRSDPE